METKQIRYGVEDLVSRIPGLFPYLEFCENGLTVVHSAKDAENGCYGKIPCGIKLPEEVNLEYNGYVLLKELHSYSYRTLMKAYYKYRDLVPDDDPFIVFMERCIGRFRIFDDMQLPDCDLVPEYGFYGECARLYAEYSTMSAMCSGYLAMKSDLGNINCAMECIVEKYTRMGGDAMMEYYRQKSLEAEVIADQLLEEIADITAGSIDINLNMVSTENDLGVLSTYLDYWVPNKTYTRGDIVIYNDRTYVCTCEEGETTEGVWDDETETVVFDEEHFEMLTCSDFTHGMEDTWNLEGTMGSMLGVFKESLVYIDEGGTSRYPGFNEDWLWYYKVGAIGNYETSTDEYGNINIKDGAERNFEIGEYETNLMAYGDVLTDIKCNTDDMTVTFTYVIGCNLKAELTDIQTDNNDITRYYYGHYTYNDNDTHGIVCTETYPFANNTEEIDDILEADAFDSYVTNRPVDYQYYRCAFDTSSSTTMVSMTVNGVPVSLPTRMTNFIVSVDNEKDVLVSPVMKKEHLVGITMNPYVEADVFVNRGNAAAWERHVKLGEVKTFEQLKSYANGGFFNLM